MQDVNGLRDRHKALNRFKGLRNDRSGFKFGFFDAKDLPNGEFYLRILPPDFKKNPTPNSIFLNSSSCVEISNDKGSRFDFVRAEALTDPSPQLVWITNYIDSVLAAIEAGVNAGQINQAAWSEDLKRAIGKLAPWVRYQIPSIWWLIKSESKYIDDKDGKEKTRRQYAATGIDQVPIGVIWDPSQETVSDRLFEIFEQLVNPPAELVAQGATPQPPPNDRFSGRLLVLKKQNTKYSLDAPFMPTPLPEALVNEFMGDDYPPLTQWRDKHKKEAAAIMSNFMNSWMIPELQQMGINLNPATPMPAATASGGGVGGGSSMMGTGVAPTPAPLSLGLTQQPGAGPAPSASPGGLNLFGL